MMGYIIDTKATVEPVVKVCRDALHVFGQEKEELVLIEELSELIAASNKLSNLDKPYDEHCADYTNFAEEIGDVLICMEYLNIGRELNDVTAIQFIKLREDPSPYEISSVFNFLLSDLIQACSELIQAVVKINRYTSPDRFNEVVKRAAILYRIVDILFKDALVGEELKELVETSIDNKIERLRQRIKQHLEIKGMLWCGNSTSIPERIAEVVSTITPVENNDQNDTEVIKKELGIESPSRVMEEKSRSFFLGGE